MPQRSDSYYDRQEVRDPLEREEVTFNALPGLIRHALDNAPWFREHLGQIEPDSISSRAALASLPILRKADSWVKGKLKNAIQTRRARAALLLAYDDAVTAAIATLKARGFNSPYLRAFVVARTNPLRFIKGTPPPLEELLP